MPLPTEEAVNRKIKALSNSLMALQIQKKRIGIRGTPKFKRDYPELDRHALDHEIVLVDKVLRWKVDPVIRHLVDTQVDLNRFWSQFYNGSAQIQCHGSNEVLPRHWLFT